MAFELTAKTQLLTQRRNIEPNLILEIEGIETLYTAIQTYKLARYGEDNIYYGMPGLVYGGGIPIENSESLISLSGSSSQLQWQLLQDQGGFSSVASLNIELIDKDGQISELVSPGFVTEELLAKKCKVYISFNGANHPEDSVLIHKGIIKQITTKPASCELTIAHPEQQKRQELFIKQTTRLVGALNNSDTTINVVSTLGFIPPYGSEIETYVQIDDEIIKVGSFNSTQLLGCTRGQLGTVADTHDNNTDLSTFYKLSGNAIDLALKLMLSNGPEYFGLEEVIHIGAISGTEPLPNILFFKYPDIEAKYGLVVGDMVKITLSGIGGNNLVDAVISEFGKTSTGSWVKVTSSLSLELNSPAVVEFKSKYNLFPEGMGMSPDDVDVERHETLRQRFSATVANYTFYLKDTINGKDFLTEQIYYPSGFYAIPRKAKASVGITVPPIAEDNIITLNELSVVKPSDLKPTRSIDKNFFNAYIIKYDELAFADKFTSAKVFVSEDSQNRIQNVGNKPKTIEAKGLRTDGATDTLTRINARRFLERYEFASESIPNIRVLFKDGFKVDVGDTVIFGSPELKVTDLKQGSKDFQPKLYEVVNKKLDLRTGDVTLDILSTNFEIDGRYGIISPSSLVVSGGTDHVIIKDSFSTVSPNKEKDKWIDYINEKIYIHNADYSIAEEIKFIGFDPQNDYKMLFDGNLSFTPGLDYVVDVPFYGDFTDNKINSKIKLLHCFFDPQLTVLNPVSQTVFDVSDISKVFVGSILRVHNYDYSVDSIEVVVSDITGSTVTVNKALGFVPSIGYFIDLVGFKDKGLAYRYI